MPDSTANFTDRQTVIKKKRDTNTYGYIRSFRECQATFGTLFYIKSGQLLFKRNVMFKRRNKEVKAIHIFIIYHGHKNRIKREAMQKAGEPLKPMRT